MTSSRDLLDEISNQIKECRLKVLACRRKAHDQNPSESNRRLKIELASAHIELSNLLNEIDKMKEFQDFIASSDEDKVKKLQELKNDGIDIDAFIQELSSIAGKNAQTILPKANYIECNRAGLFNHTDSERYQ